MKIMIRVSLMLAAMLVAFGTRPASAAILDVTIDTSPLVGAGLFQIDFQLIDGSGFGDASTTVQVRDINGAFNGMPLVEGGASGEVVSGIDVTDSAFFNAFTVPFTAGPALSFRLIGMASPGGLTPDLFTVSLVRYALPDGSATLEFFPLLDVEFGEPRTIAAYDVAGVNLAAPTVTEVSTPAPEPGLLALGAVMAAGLRRRLRLRQEQPSASI